MKQRQELLCDNLLGKTMEFRFTGRQIALIYQALAAYHNHNMVPARFTSCYDCRAELFPLLMQVRKFIESNGAVITIQPKKRGKT